METSTLRKKWRDRSHWERKGGKFPLSFDSGRRGVSHPVEHHIAKWLFLSIPLWGSTKVEPLSRLVRCMEILHDLLSGKKHCVLFQFAWLGSHFRAENKKKRPKGGGGVIHYECMNSSLYNCLWSASSLVVKEERETESCLGHRKLQSPAQLSHLTKERNRGRNKKFWTNENRT